MHTALNKTLAALPDDTKVYVSITFKTFQKGHTDFRSLAMSTPSRM